jgi:hypothetical protein
MEQGPSWETNSSSASQEISRIFRQPRVNYPVHRSPPLVLIPELDQSSPGPRSVSKIHLNKSSHLRLDLPSGLLPSDFPIKTPYISQPRSPCFSWYCHLNNILSGVLSMKLFIMPSPPVSYYLVLPRPKYLPQTLPSDTLSPFSSLNVRPFSYQYQRVQLHFCINALLNRKKNINIMDTVVTGNPWIQYALN